jgi:hypothetical protein
VIACPSPFGAALDKKGYFHERNQYLPRSAHRGVHDPAAPLEAQAETAIGWVSITEDVPVLRIDNLATKSSLLGVWRSQLLKAVALIAKKETFRAEAN